MTYSILLAHRALRRGSWSITQPWYASEACFQLEVNRRGRLQPRRKNHCGGGNSGSCWSSETSAMKVMRGWIEPLLQAIEPYLIAMQPSPQWNHELQAVDSSLDDTSSDITWTGNPTSCFSLQVHQGRAPSSATRSKISTTALKPATKTQRLFILTHNLQNHHSREEPHGTHPTLRTTRPSASSQEIAHITLLCLDSRDLSVFLPPGRPAATLSFSLKSRRDPRDLSPSS